MALNKIWTCSSKIFGGCEEKYKSELKDIDKFWETEDECNLKCGIPSDIMFEVKKHFDPKSLISLSRTSTRPRKEYKSELNFLKSYCTQKDMKELLSLLSIENKILGRASIPNLIDIIINNPELCTTVPLHIHNYDPNIEAAKTQAKRLFQLEMEFEFHFDWYQIAKSLALKLVQNPFSHQSPIPFHGYYWTILLLEILIHIREIPESKDLGEFENITDYLQIDEKMKDYIDEHLLESIYRYNLVEYLPELALWPSDLSNILNLIHLELASEKEEDYKEFVDEADKFKSWLETYYNLLEFLITRASSKEVTKLSKLEKSLQYIEERIEIVDRELLGN